MNDKSVNKDESVDNLVVSLDHIQRIHAHVIEYETNRLYKKELKRLLKETESKLDNCSNSSKKKEYIEFIEFIKKELKELENF